MVVLLRQRRRSRPVRAGVDRSGADSGRRGWEAGRGDAGERRHAGRWQRCRGVGQVGLARRPRPILRPPWRIPPAPSASPRRVSWRSAWGSPVAGIAHATSIAAGRAHACALVDDKIVCWGDDSHGQLGGFSIAK
jgi:hypothetical protein